MPGQRGPDLFIWQTANKHFFSLDEKGNPKEER